MPTSFRCEKWEDEKRAGRSLWEVSCEGEGAVPDRHPLCGDTHEIRLV